MKVEEQLLPDKALAPIYDKAVWVYVYQTFKKDEADRAAKRISLRFGVTSWPQMFLIDPATFETLAHTGRTKEGFLSAFGRVKVEQGSTEDVHAALVDAEALAIELEEKPTKKLALATIDDADIVVRYRALQVLADEDPKAIVKRAVEFLAVQNDPFRYTVCEALAKAEDPRANDALEAIVEKPEKSLNPNVLRMRAVHALGACGDVGSVAVIEPHATSGAYFNGLTGTSVDALAAIAARHKKARKAARAALIRAYPAPPAEEKGERAMRACVTLAKRVHRALDSKKRFPDPYDEEARETLMKQKP